MPSARSDIVINSACGCWVASLPIHGRHWERTSKYCANVIQVLSMLFGNPIVCGCTVWEPNLMVISWLSCATTSWMISTAPLNMPVFLPTHLSWLDTEITNHPGGTWKSALCSSELWGMYSIPLYTCTLILFTVVDEVLTFHTLDTICLNELLDASAVSCSRQ